ncbi:putative reverse transcriptase domain-containing protein, partial [Tanacetum coccineum]
DVEVHGYNMFKLVKILRHLKKPLRKLLHSHEAYLNAFTQATLDEECFLKRKAKIEWLHVGDANSSYFHRVVVSKLSQNKAVDMIQEVSDAEIRSVMFSIGNDKALGLDGYTSIFFKKSWDIEGGESFLGEILVGFGFHVNMVKWIMTCVTRTSFSIHINGDLHGYFKEKRGLHQGDPMSPYLFTLVMEVLTLILKRKVREEGDFAYHNRCSKLKIINICFADNLIMFSRGDATSARYLMEALNEYKEVSGLVSSIPKSMVFMCNVPAHIKDTIMHLMPFQIDTLSVKYLCVPLISSRLLYKDRKIHVERVRKRIGDWKNKWLSFAGRLHLGVYFHYTSWDYPRSQTVDVWILMVSRTHETSRVTLWDGYCPLPNEIMLRPLNPYQVSKIIVDVVLLKLASIQFKKKASVEQMRNTRRLSSLINDGG